MSKFKKPASGGRKRPTDGKRSFKKRGEFDKSSDRPAFPVKRKRISESGERRSSDFRKRTERPEGEKFEFKKRRESGDKPFFKKRSGSEERPSYPRKSFDRDDSKPSRFDKPERNSSRPAFRDSERPSASRNRDERGPAKRREGRAWGGESKSRGDFEKPRERKEGDFQRTSRPPSRDDERSSSTNDKPFTERRSGYSDKPRPARRDDERSSSTNDKPFTERRSGYNDKSRPARRDGDRPASSRPTSSGRTNDRFSPRPSAGKRFGDDRREKSSDESDAPKWNRKESHEFYGDRRKSGYQGKSKSSGKRETAADDGLTRLNKYISNAGICSRREADDLITAGVISVNGEIITELGYKVKDGDIVKYNNQALRSERLVYILLNKPKDFITTTDDPEERKTVMSLIEKAGKERVYPVGRLDRNTTGVLLLTNDGDLARKLTHPSFEVQKVYQVELDRSLKSSDYQQISEGVTLDDGFVKVDDIAYVGAGNDKSIVGVEIHSGRNRIVRRLFEHFEYRVKKLDRVVFAGLTKKDLSRGRWRFLSEMEVANLKMMTGSKKVKA